MQILKDRNIVITGGSRGFGLAVARACSKAGANVAVASRSEKSVNAAAEILRGTGQAMGIVCDATTLDQVKALAQQVYTAWGSIDVWINNAGIAGPYGPVLAIPPDVFKRVLNVNIMGTYHGSLVALHYFLAQGSGKLINILGYGDKRPAPMQTAYGSSKTWILSFTRALAQENKDSGVSIFAYNPGMMRTDLLMNVEVIEGYEERLKPFESIVRMWAKSPDIPARRVVQLASSASDGKTDQVLHEMNA
ncbi:MAG: SDR family NAD(P)-dependent oxidoreductase, partial [Anaerolineae bacterium]|nr:SDR family NAD(P)-dependent oxidoreductase [Anaerolineae bacterium]